MKKVYFGVGAVLLVIFGIVLGGSAKAETFTVTSCEQVGSDIRISRNNGPKYILSSSCRDAGHGLRLYKLKCVSSTQYSVEWSTPSSCTDRDTTRPTAALSASKAWAQNGDSVSVTATATDNKAVTKIELYEDSSVIKTCTGSNVTVCTYTFNAAAHQSTEKTRVFKAQAYDAAGNVGNSSVVVVHIVPTQDTTKPEVTLSANNTLIKSGQQITLTSTASDASGISKIDVYQDGVKVKTCSNTTQCLYTTTLALPSWADARVYTFHARAIDTRGNEKITGGREVRVIR